MNVIELKPTDVLFFRDGRPMSGSLPGRGAAWPLPNVLSHAIHAALWRAGIDGVHEHRRWKSGRFHDSKPSERFGSLRTMGPFPVVNDHWLFPRPLDLMSNHLQADLLPFESCHSSSLPVPLRYPVANRKPPSKEVHAKAWISQSAFQRYLTGGRIDSLEPHEAWNDEELFDSEAQIGIEIDPRTGNTGSGEQEGKIYSAHYLRLRELDTHHRSLNLCMGVMADAWDEDLQCDLLGRLLDQSPTSILVGGQQRICSAKRTPAKALPLPKGMSSGFHQIQRNGKDRLLVKWVLLSPAVFPEVRVSEGKSGQPQPGGWLPNWVCQQTGSVLLKNGDTRRGYTEKREEWRARIQAMSRIGANLVAAIVPKPLVVTGWALANPDAGRQEGAKPTHLAVPAGAVYYFEADTPEYAIALAAALNWHGSDPNCNTIRNRRSTLLGEKGFGIGVCGTWDFYSGPK